MKPLTIVLAVVFVYLVGLPYYLLILREADLKGTVEVGQKQIENLEARVLALVKTANHNHNDQGAHAAPGVLPPQSPIGGFPPPRPLPDTRPKECLALHGKYRKDMLKTTVILVNHNEPNSVVLRTVQSILARTPDHLLEEILVIDDASKPIMDSEIAVQPKTRVIRHLEQKGLLVARTRGAEEAKGGVLVFLDAHCEANEGWLEPLVESVMSGPRIVAWPSIDIIDHTSFEYQGIDGISSIAGFNIRDLTFGYDLTPKSYYSKWTSADPKPTPGFPGGLFAITKEYWNQWGGYDLDMGFWGTENVDMAARIWMCGGQILEIPCSRVGHVYRDPNGVPTYVTSSGINARVRMALVWFDDYKYFFFKYYHLGQDVIAKAGDLTKMQEIRKKMQCKDFRWFHENVYPILPIPGELASNFSLNINWTTWIESSTPNNRLRSISLWFNADDDYPEEISWTLASLKYAGAGKDTDLLVFYQPKDEELIPSECKRVLPGDINVVSHEQARCYAIAVVLPESVLSLKFNAIHSYYPYTVPDITTMMAKYGFICKTEMGSFFTPRFKEYYPAENKVLQLGEGAYANDAATKDKILAIASKRGLRHQSKHNLGITMYADSPMLLRVAKLAYETTEYILKEEFKDGPGSWPGWYRGVAHKYGAEIAINQHCENYYWQTKYMDGRVHEGATCSFVHIGAWDSGADGFSRQKYFAKEYDGMDVDELNLQSNKNWALYVSLKSSGRDKNKGEIKKPVENICWR